MNTHKFTILIQKIKFYTKSKKSIYAKISDKHICVIGMKVIVIKSK